MSNVAISIKYTKLTDKIENRLYSVQETTYKEIKDALIDIVWDITGYRAWIDTELNVKSPVVDMADSISNGIAMQTEQLLYNYENSRSS